MTLSLKLATPAHVSGSLLKPVSPEFRSELASIVYPSLAAVALGYPDESIKHPLAGFGMLIPSQEKKQALGALFSSTLFPKRTPEGHVLFTCFIGGRRNPMAVENSDHQLVNLVSEELREMLDIQARPVFARVARWANAIPQYDVRHLTRIAKIDDIAERYKGLHLMGNWRDGISVGDGIDSGFAMADRLMTAER